MGKLLRKLRLSSSVCWYASMLGIGMLASGCSGDGTDQTTSETQDTASTTVSKMLPAPENVKTVDANNPNLAGNEYEEKYPNGVIHIKGYVLNGMREGQWLSFYNNGKPWSQSVYKRGRLNGPTATWYESGNRRYTGEYAEDQRAGKWTFWDEDGKLIKEISYDKQP